jgi:hypothetical protein
MSIAIAFLVIFYGLLTALIYILIYAYIFIIIILASSIACFIALFMQYIFKKFKIIGFFINSFIFIISLTLILYIFANDYSKFLYIPIKSLKFLLNYIDITRLF